MRALALRNRDPRLSNFGPPHGFSSKQPHPIRYPDPEILTGVETEDKIGYLGGRSASLLAFFLHILCAKDICCRID